MIDKLLVQNFQGLKLKKVQFSPTITAITGPTDAGKSSLFRAMWWVVANRPTGEGFVRRGCKDAVDVRMWVDSVRVQRKRDGSKTNIYRVGDAEPLEAFGTGVPESVTKVLRLSRQNFQEQLDPPFWFTLSPSELAREINTIVDLSCIDEVVGAAQGEVRDARSEMRVSEKRLAELDQEVENSRWVLEMDRDYQKIESLRRRIDQITLQERALDEESSNLAERQRRLEEFESLLGDFSALDGIFEDFRGMGELSLRLGEVVLMMEVEETGDELFADFEYLERLFGELGILEEADEDLETRCQVLDSLSAEVWSTGRQLVVLERGLKVRFGMCPLCGRSL